MYILFFLTPKSITYWYPDLKKKIMFFFPCLTSYLVTVFDDGDEKTLRRSSLCLKGERHFAESEVIEEFLYDNFLFRKI